jgi:hypothetical protein
MSNSKQIEKTKNHNESKQYLELADQFRDNGDVNEAIDYYFKAYDEPDLKGATLVRLKRLVDNRLISFPELNKIGDFAVEAFKKDSHNKQLIALIIKTFNYLNKTSESILFCQQLVYRENLTNKPEFLKQFWGKSRGPDFIITGFLKCGTTSLYEYMIKHPNILQISQKELMFFNVEKNYTLGLDWYLSNFPPIPESADYISGEASTLYCLNKLAGERVKKHFPNTKLIFILRNPVNRAISNYFFNQKQIGKNQKTLEEVIERETKKINKLIHQGKDIGTELSGSAGIISSGLYVYFIEKWLHLFPREQVLFLQTETLAKEPQLVMDTVFNFLNLPEHTISQSVQKNAGSYSPIEEHLKQRMAEFYRPHNQKLEEYLGMSFGWDL